MDKFRIYNTIGWVLFAGSSIYMFYVLITGFIGSLQSTTDFFLVFENKTRWIISTVVFFIGVFCIYYAHEKSL